MLHGNTGDHKRHYLLNAMFTIFKKKTAKRICLTTYYDRPFSAIGDICARSIRAYARLHNLDARFPGGIVSDRPAPWWKILVIKRLFAEQYDYVAWIDADALFVDYRKSIADVITDGKEMYLVRHRIESRDVPNTGVWIMRNSEWSSRFLDAVWAKQEYLHHQWWENAAVIDALGYQGLLSADCSDEINHETLEKVCWLGVAWNSLPGICESDRPIIKHYASRRPGHRLAGMTNDAILYRPPGDPSHAAAPKTVPMAAWEGRWDDRWIGARARCLLPVFGDARDYTFEGFAEPHAAPVSLVIRQDGKRIKKITVAAAGRFSFSLRVTPRRDAAFAVIEVRASKSFNPKELGLSADDRNLSVRLALRDPAISELCNEDSL